MIFQTLSVSNAPHTIKPLPNSPANVRVEDKQILRIGRAEGTIIRRIRSVDHIAKVTLGVLCPQRQLLLILPRHNMSRSVDILLARLHHKRAVVVVGFLQNITKEVKNPLLCYIVCQYLTWAYRANLRLLSGFT